MNRSLPFDHLFDCSFARLFITLVCSFPLRSFANMMKVTSMISRLAPLSFARLLVCSFVLVLFPSTVLSTGSESTHAVDLEGRPIDPLTATDTKVTVLLFTMIDCPIANRYAPELHRIYDQFRSRGVEFWLVYADPNNSADQIREHLKGYDYHWRAVSDPDHALVQLAGATRTPEAAVFVTANQSSGDAPQRHLIYRGRIDNWYQDFGKNRPEPTTHDLEDAIAAALEGRQVSNPRTSAVGCYLRDLK